MDAALLLRMLNGFPARTLRSEFLIKTQRWNKDSRAAQALVCDNEPPIGEHVMVMVKTENRVKDALDHIRVAAQELHGALSDAAAKRGGAVKHDLEAIPQQAKAVAESVKSSMAAQNEVAKKHLAEAITSLEATQKHAAESLKGSGQAFETSVRQAIADARAAVQKVSEAVAATRSAASTKSSKK